MSKDDIGTKVFKLWYGELSIDELGCPFEDFKREAVAEFGEGTIDVLKVAYRIQQEVNAKFANASDEEAEQMLYDEVLSQEYVRSFLAILEYTPYVPDLEALKKKISPEKLSHIWDELVNAAKASIPIEDERHPLHGVAVRYDDKIKADPDFNDKYSKLASKMRLVLSEQTRKINLMERLLTLREKAKTDTSDKRSDDDGER